MTAPPTTPPGARQAGGFFAHLRVGACDIAVPVADIVQAIDLPAGGLTPLPRRQGGLDGVVEFEGGVVPVVALDRWVALGKPAAPGDAAAARIVVLRDGATRIALRADALKGVLWLAGDAIHLTCQDADPDELFAAVAPANGGRPLLCLLEVARLMALTATWCEAVGLERAEASETTIEHAAPALRYAVVRVGDDLWALPAGSIAGLVKAPTAELHWAGRRVCGIGSWSARKLPMVDLAAGDPADPARPLMAVVAEGPLAIGLVVSRCERMVALAADQIAPAPGDDLLLGTARVDGLGKVSVLAVDGLFRGVPEAEISRARPAGAGQPGPPAAGTAAAAHGAGPGPGATSGATPGAIPAASTASDAETHYLVFEADRSYASPATGVMGVLALPAEAIEVLSQGRRARVDWRGQSLDVVNLPPMDGRPRTPEPRIAVVLKGEAGEAHSAIAVSRLTRWLPAHLARRSNMRLPWVGEVSVITPPGVLRDASMVVVDLAQMAYMLN